MSNTVQLIVTLSKGQYESLKNIQCGSIGSRMIVNAVMNGIPLDGMTNGEVIQALYPNIVIHKSSNGVMIFAENFDSQYPQEFYAEWWNTPYKAESEE